MSTNTADTVTTLSAPPTPDTPFPVLEITLEALKDRLEGLQMLVLPYPKVEKSKGGIVLAGSAALRPPLAWVIDMSDGAKEVLGHTRIGDTVILAGDQALPLFTIGEGPGSLTYSLVSASAQDTPLSMKGKPCLPKTS